MPMPMGMDKWFPVLGTAIPGMESMMTMMMKQKIKAKGVASIEELRENKTEIRPVIDRLEALLESRKK